MKGNAPLFLYNTKMRDPEPFFMDLCNLDLSSTDALSIVHKLQRYVISRGT